jgi:hypothetical protein
MSTAAGLTAPPIVVIEVSLLGTIPVFVPAGTSDLLICCFELLLLAEQARFELATSPAITGALYPM